MNGDYLQEIHDKVMSMPEMHPSYLDDKDIDEFNLPRVTVVIPTYNRAPHTAEEDANPLGWCLESLLAQKGGSLDEIVVVDDASSDYTCDVVSSFSRDKRVNINYLKNISNIGSSKSRNLAVRSAKNDRVMFLDDDCIFSNYFVWGANFTLENSPEDVALIHMPVYHRKVKSFPVDGEKIGILDLERAIVDGNYGGFPIEYLKDIGSYFLDRDLGVLSPIEIKNLGGVFISRKDCFEDIGGFPENLSWRNGYREETHVAMKFSDRGYKMFFTPDPKFHSVHLKYGAHSGEEEGAGENYRLKRLISHSNVGREDTGNRVDPEEWFFDRIISTYVTIGKRSEKAAKKYLKDTMAEFVIENKLSVAGVGTRINNKKKRKEIFNRAVVEGDKLLREGV